MTEENRQHLEFIQNTITRINTNSFQLKEMTILIITACLAIYASDNISLMLLIPVFPTIIFWVLDSYYLLQEKKFRAIYNDVSGVKVPKIYNVKLYEMPIDKYTSKRDPQLSLWNVFKSETIGVFYLSLINLLIIVYDIVYYCNLN